MEMRKSKALIVTCKQVGIPGEQSMKKSTREGLPFYAARQVILSCRLLGAFEKF